MEVGAYVLEEPLATPEEERHEVDLHLVEVPGREVLRSSSAV